MDVLIFGIDQDLWMSYRVLLCRHVHEFDLLSLRGVSNLMKFDGVGASTEEGVSGLQWVNNFKPVKELLEVCIGCDLLVKSHFHLTWR